VSRSFKTGHKTGKRLPNGKLVTSLEHLMAPARVSRPVPRFLSALSPGDPSRRYDVDGDQEEPDIVAARRFSDTKSIGSLSQYLFDSDEDERFFGTCNGYVSQPGSKSNLLLCSECDQHTRTCTYRPQTPGSYAGRYVEERVDDRLQEPGTSRVYRSPVKLPSPRSHRPADQESHVAQAVISSPRSYHEYPEQSLPVVTSPRSGYRTQQQQQQQQQQQGQQQQRRGWIRDAGDRGDVNRGEYLDQFWSED